MNTDILSQSAILRLNLGHSPSSGVLGRYQHLFMRFCFCWHLAPGLGLCGPLAWAPHLSGLQACLGLA